METTTIYKTVGLGDAGTPFNLAIDVLYEQNGNTIIVHECIEQECPYDNPSELWYKRIEQITDDYFYDLSPAYSVKFI